MADAMGKGALWFFCAVRIAGIFHKACNLLFCVFLCGETAMMHRCCGVYDLESLRVAAALPNSLPTCVCQGRYARTSFCQVCAVTAVPHGRGDRSERDAWANPPRSPRCCYRLLSPKLCWVYGIHLPSLRWSSCIWCASHTVWMTLVLRLSVMPVPIVSYSYSFF
ncbi:putative retrotransposon hot spot protein (RHS) [Trypanosoma cruzi]|uniref:Putative retrotransposon hot spot protein (RHS) n=1 Tax=Trypanosoma cruzi TaxID=5693 RepID=A0A2V2W480_TRYCR|nr:putative retrotransposon hot spot protein (RHS) [Trypanosoma cruzi]RNC53792.1 hypothetical protein TcCL_ESM08841 [Trypanosoma cruzi]